jgi:hypothetical protein
VTKDAELARIVKVLLTPRTRGGYDPEIVITALYLVFNAGKILVGTAMVPLLFEMEPSHNAAGGREKSEMRWVKKAMLPKPASKLCAFFMRVYVTSINSPSKY